MHVNVDSDQTVSTCATIWRCFDNGQKAADELGWEDVRLLIRRHLKHSTLTEVHVAGSLLSRSTTEHDWKAPKANMKSGIYGRRDKRSWIHWNTRKPSYRWQTRATLKHAKNCSNSTCLLRCRWQYWPICICLAVVASEICEIPEKFTENSNLWSSRSSKVIDLGVNGKSVCDFILVINSNFSHICYRFQDFHG